MPQVSTTTPGSKASTFAERIVKQTDEIVNSYDIAYLLLIHDLGRAADNYDEEEADRAIKRFLAAIALLISISTVQARFWVARNLAELYKVPNWQSLVNSQESELPIPGIPEAARQRAIVQLKAAIEEEDRMNRKLAALIEDGQASARMMSVFGGISYLSALIDSALGRAEAYNFRKVLDASATENVEEEIGSQGSGFFKKKIVIAMLDDRTTALCSRLDGTVWDWDEPIVDPATGASKMFSPFIGPQFTPAYHCCRTAVVPFTGVNDDGNERQAGEWSQ
jgi:hypothetical protein